MASKGAFVVKTVDYSQDETLPGSVLTQKRTLTSWINYNLQKRNIKIWDLRNDLKDGVALINLIEILTNKSIGVYSKKPRIRVQLMVNCSKFIAFLKEHNISISGGITPDDICDGNLKAIMNMIWNLTQQFHINKGRNTTGFTKSVLLSWIQEKVDVDYGCYPRNFNTDWSDGDVIYAIVDSLDKGKLGWKDRTRDPIKDTCKAMEFAAEYFGIPMLMDPVDMVREPDDSSLLIYIRYFQLFDEGQFMPISKQTNIRWYEDQLPPPCNAKKATKTSGTSTPTESSGEADRVVPHTYEDLAQLQDGGASIIYQYQYDLRDKYVFVGGSGLTGGTIGQDSPIFIKITNKQRQLIDFDKENIRITFRGPEAVPKELIVPLTNNSVVGSFAIIYRPAVPGKYNIFVVLDEIVIIRGLTATWFIATESASKQVPKTDPQKCTVSGFVNCRENSPITFVIISNDSQGNRMTTGGDTYDIVISSENGKTCPFTITDNNTGKYVVKFIPVDLGIITASIKIDQYHIQGSPFSAHVIPASEIACVPYGSGLHSGIVGSPAQFLLYTHDLENKSIPVPPSAFTITLNGRKDIDVSLSAEATGTILATYYPMMSGQYKLNILLYGQPVPHLPPSLVVIEEDGLGFVTENPSNLNLQASHVRHFLPVYARNRPFAFRVLAYNKQGGGLEEGSFEVYAFAFGGEDDGTDTFCNVRRIADGEYEVVVLPKLCGRLDIDVSIGDVPIPGSPFETEIIDLFNERISKIDFVDPNLCTIEDLGTYRVNTTSAFRIVSRSMDGTLKKTGGDKFQIIITDQDNNVLPTEIRDNEDGEYFVIFIPFTEGLLNIRISLHDVPIKGSPFCARVIPEGSFRCSFVGQNVSGGNFRYGPLHFQILAQDETDNPINVWSSVFQIQTSGPGGPITTEISSSIAGIYDVWYTPKLSGKYLLTISIGETCVGTLVLSCTNHPDLVVTGLVGKSDGFVHHPITFGITLKERHVDNHGRVSLRTYQDEDNNMALVVTGAENTTGSITANAAKDGGYTISYIPRTEGLHVLSIKYLPTGTIPVKDILSTVIQPSDPHQCSVEGLQSTVNVDGTSTFLIQAKNCYGKPISSGGEPFHVIIADSSNIEIPIEFTDNRNGEYSVAFVPRASGVFTINVTLYGKPVSGSPYTVTAVTEISASLCELVGTFIEIQDTDIPELSIVSYDKKEQKMEPLSQPSYTAELFTPLNTKVPLQLTFHRNNGLTDIVWDSRLVRSGNYTIHVKLNNVHIKKSPFTFRVKQGVDPLYSAITFVRARTFCELVIYTLNKEGQPQQLSGGEKLNVQVVGPLGPVSDVSFIDNRNGTHTLGFEAPSKGEYSISATIGGLHLRGSPFQCIIPPTQIKQ